MPTESRFPSPDARLPPKLEIAGSVVSAVGFDETLRHVRRAVAGDRASLTLAVTNANKAWLASRHPDLRAFLDTAELVVAESSTVWAARRLGLRGVEPVWGVELMGRLLTEASARGWSVFLLGARPEVVERLRTRISERWPGARVVGARDGFFGPDEADAVREQVVGSDADLLIVAMGSPRQERFIASLPRDAAPRVRIGVGGSFDVHAGLKRDAPGWVRGSGFEWLYRALQSPRLFRRYLVVNPWFVLRVVRQRLGRSGARTP